MHVMYPKTLDSECITEAFRIIRNGVGDEGPALGEHIWNLQGFAQRKFIGATDTFLAAAGEDDLTAEQREQLTALAAELEGKQDEVAQKLAACCPDEERVAADKALPWALLIQIFLAFIKQWLPS